MGKNPFNVVLTSQDLSSSSTTLNLTQDLGNTTAVTLNGTAGNMGALCLVSPYGQFLAGRVMLSGSSATLNVTNPGGYQCYTVQAQTVPNYPTTGYSKNYISLSNIAPVSASMTLPAVNTSLGPTGFADPSSLAYSSGTLSVAAVPGAGFYAFFLQAPGGWAYCIIGSATNSVALPGWLQSDLAGNTVRVTTSAGDVEFPFSLEKVAEVLYNGSGAFGATLATVDSTTGANWKDITF